MNDNWQEIAREVKHSGGPISTVVQFLTLGLAEKPEVWEIEYKNRVTGQTVRGTGPSPAAAEQRARALMSA